MRTDLVVGVIVSVAAHAALLLGTPPRPPRFVTAPTPPEEIVEWDIPPIPPEEEEAPVEELKEELTSQPAPPSLLDVPSANLTAFQMKLQPPPPPGLLTSTLTSIPVGRGYGPPGGKIPNVFNPADLEQQPTLTAPVQPVYPFKLRSQGITGSVTVEFIVTSGGRTTSASVIHSTDREFERAALDAVEKWQFRPGRKAGRAVNTRVQQVITFKLNES